ncbi:MAG TPA: lamin tail domain-containing protein, partial [Methylomirabilota bacterium]|nr:lamin tail domain-containing protein [Methylomirabilota bacterium]
MRNKIIVINEIMYNPVSDDDNDEFVEIYNRSANPVNLSNWRFNDGIDFTFPTNTIIASNGYIVVAKNAARLIANYPNLSSGNTVGNYEGTLANSGERLALTMPDYVPVTNIVGVVTTNVNSIVVDEVLYGTGGRWGKWSDGGGSSLELIDPRSDNRLSSNWTDSDDTAKSVWSTISVNGILDHGDGRDFDSLQVTLLERGECLLDNVSVTLNGGVNLVTNGGFENNLTGWVRQGTHRTTFIENAGDTGSRSLHVVAEDRGDTGANRIYTILLAKYTNTMSGVISARVKWLHGKKEILLRLRGNHLEVPGVMTIPKNLGTPGARNSRYVSNVGPGLTEVTHTPVLPAANQPVVITGRVHDPDGVGSVQLTYRVDPFGGSFSVPMVDNGTGGDAVAGDGIYSGTIPGQANDAMVAFYVTATDGHGTPASTKFPNDAPVRECLVHFGESQPLTTFGTYRFWMTQATLNDWVTQPKLSSDRFPGTFVYGNFRPIYNAASHYAGSPAHTKLYDTPMGTNCDYQLLFPADDQLLNSDSVRLQEPGLVGADRTGQAEQFGYWLINQLGQPALNRRSVNMFMNGLRRGLIYEDTQRQNADWSEQWFPNSIRDLDDLYRIGFWYEFSNDTLSRSDQPPSLLPFITTGGAKKLARYRQTFQKRAVKNSPHNYTNLFQLVDAVNTTATGDAYAAQVFPLVDITSFAQAFAAERIINNTDLYGARRLNGTETKPGSQNSFL